VEGAKCFTLINTSINEIYGEYTMLLEHIKGIAPDTELEAEFASLDEEIRNLLDQMSVIMEAPMGAMSDRLAGQEPAAPTGNMPAPGGVEAGGGSMEEVMTAMEQVMKQMEAARRGLGLVNKLADSPSRTTNRSRVMGNLNRIRGNLRRIEKMLATQQ